MNGSPVVLAALLGLGALHGLNPAMGWLFAVALGLQEKRGRAVWRALAPLALGHALAIAAVVAVVGVVGVAMPARELRLALAVLLVLFGGFRLFRHAHFRYGGMRMGLRQLTVWSFLMATAHGAGLMVLPLLLPPSGATEPMAMMKPMAHGSHAAHSTLAASFASGPVGGLVATLAHTLGYLAVMGLIAVLVYEKLGLQLLRKAWINLDLIWAAALIATGVATAVL